MPAPSYPHRHLLLTNLLDSRPPSPPDAFAVDGQVNERGCKLDALLLEGWTATGSKAALLDRDVLQHAESLRLKTNDFEILGRVGEGQFGVVDAVRSKLDGKVYAMKTIEKSMAMRAGSQHLSLGLERHIHSLADASSPTCPAPAFAAAFQSPNALHLVTSFAPCGSLWDRMCEILPAPGREVGPMDEHEVSWWAKQMVRAISWLHGQGFAHRDIKPHNFLLLPDCRLWLTDFGSAAPLSNGTVPRRHCLVPTGTPDYVAPEVLRIAEEALIAAAHSDADESNSTLKSSMNVAGYGPEIDWWSLGATLFEMTVGRAPFFSPSIGSTYEKIMRCDVTMPGTMSPQLKSLLSGLLSPSDVRLGCDETQIERHAFFREWTGQPPNLVCQPLDLGTLAESFIHSTDDITFDHFFDSTIAGGTTATTSPSMVMPATWGRWVGWSLDPPADFFGTEPPAITISPPTLKPIAGTVRQHSAPPATNLFTPLRPGIAYGATPPTVPRTAPRSVPRTRPVSERQALAELIQCVQASARKKLLQSTIKVPGSASTVSSASSVSSNGWHKEHPPTPTPVSRDVTVLTGLGRNGSGERPLSRNSDALTALSSPMFPPRPISRTPSLLDLPQRGFVRTSSLPNPLGAERTPSLTSLRSGGTMRAGPDSTATQSLSSRNNIRSLSSTPHSQSHSRPLSLASVRGDPVPRASSASLKDDTFLSKLVAVDERPRSQSRSQSRSLSAELHELPDLPDAPREPQCESDGCETPKAEPEKPSRQVRPLPRRNDVPNIVASPNSASSPSIPNIIPSPNIVTSTPVVPPTTAPSAMALADPFLERCASMKKWHDTIEDGFQTLETRLAELMAQLTREF